MTGKRVEFWTRQAIQLATAAIAVVAVLSIWFDNPGRLSTFLGLVTAGVAFAMQRVVTALAAYFVLLRGNTFNVGDRIKMGGVRGDVIALGLIQTTIMEMGEPPDTQSEDPGMWVHSRQYSGRIVTVTNDKIFEEPVYNYSRDFPFIWEEMRFGIHYDTDYARSEKILLDVATRQTAALVESSQRSFEILKRRYSIQQEDMTPRVFWRATDNWLELALRFIAHPDRVREMKDQMTRAILGDFAHEHISIASGTYEISGMPVVRIQTGPDVRQGDRDGVRTPGSPAG